MLSLACSCLTSVGDIASKAEAIGIGRLALFEAVLACDVAFESALAQSWWQRHTEKGPWGWFHPFWREQPQSRNQSCIVALACKLEVSLSGPWNAWESRSEGMAQAGVEMEYRS
jgi:hypothetical protein